MKDAAVIGEQHQREFNFEDMIRELGDDSFTAKPVKTAISVLASKINIIREVLERMHPGSISCKFTPVLFIQISDHRIIFSAVTLNHETPPRRSFTQNGSTDKS